MGDANDAPPSPLSGTKINKEVKVLVTGYGVRITVPIFSSFLLRFFASVEIIRSSRFRISNYITCQGCFRSTSTMAGVAPP